MVATAAVGAAAAATGAAVYYWWYGGVEEEEPPRGGYDRTNRNSLDATSRALGAPQKPEFDKHMHFDQIQKISDSTTLPQMLIELGKGLDRVANVDVIVSELRHPSVLKGLGRLGKSKVEMWDDLKLLSWSRTLSATWLVGILDLLLRVQLNILGRHLFVQQQWSGRGQGRRITERSQEMFLEYAHYLPERSSFRVVSRMKELVAVELADVDLRAPLNADQAMQHFTSLNEAFEDWAVEEGWAQLVLPSKEEAEEYFVNFRLNKAVDHASMVEDENIVQGMVDELHMVMKSVRFSVATLGAVQEAAKQVEIHVRSEVGAATMPLAKLIPKITSAGDKLMDVKSVLGGQEWLHNVSSLPKVRELCSSVYSCGPPP